MKSAEFMTQLRSIPSIDPHPHLPFQTMLAIIRGQCYPTIQSSYADYSALETIRPTPFYYSFSVRSSISIPFRKITRCVLVTLQQDECERFFVKRD
jgi:hypothetical protein